MKLVILPGLDGTGKLFQSLLDTLPADVEPSIIPYPDDEPMGYEALEQYVLERLPQTEPYILLAESFAGPLGYRLACREIKNMVAVIFVATFLRNPNPGMVSFVQRLPMSLLMKLRAPKAIMRRYFLGKEARPEMMKLLGDILLAFDARVFACRINEVANPPPFGKKLTLPCYYIQTTADRLVMPDNVEDFKTIAEQLKVIVVKGSHFILQANPQDSAKAIVDVVQEIRQILGT